MRGKVRNSYIHHCLVANLINPILEVLKQPLHTSIAIDTTEFSQFNVEDMLHIIISVKDFKAIVQHAGSLDTEVSAAYSYPSKPMQLKYGDEGVTSEFILMTIGDYKATSAVPLLNAIMRNSTSAPSRQHTEDPSVASAVQQPAASMQLPPRSGATPATLLGHRARALRHSPPLPQPSINSDSLFLPDDEEDRRWNPSGYGGEDEELLGWDAGTDTVRTAILKSCVWFSYANLNLGWTIQGIVSWPPRELSCSPQYTWVYCSTTKREPFQRSTYATSIPGQRTLPENDSFCVADIFRFVASSTTDTETLDHKSYRQEYWDHERRLLYIPLIILLIVNTILETLLKIQQVV